MKRQKLPELGTTFLVPLRDNGFAWGVLARANGKGSAFGYFFGPRVRCAEEVVLANVAPGDALLVRKFGDLDLIRGHWPLVGIVSGWTREYWPMPPMSRIDEKVGRAWVSTYDDILHCVSEKEIAFTDASRYLEDGLMGGGAVEVRLTKLIREKEGRG